jgi:hypothetical protein
MRQKSPVAALQYLKDFDSFGPVHDDAPRQLQEPVIRKSKCQSNRSALKNISSKKRSKNYTFLQKINRYIKAGIEEGSILALIK